MAAKTIRNPMSAERSGDPAGPGAAAEPNRAPT